MVHEDFDTSSLASYLHITPQQVERLASREKLPGRKVAGQWRFSRADIHHWLESRLGLLEDDHLDHVQRVLDRSAPATDERPVRIAALLPREAIAIPLNARTRNSVIKKMVETATRTGFVWDPERLTEAVRQREEMQSTALEIGVALLHPRRPMPSIIGEPLLALGITSQGIPFGKEGVLSDIFFLICSTSDRGHLRTLARLSRLISIGDFLTAIRSVADKYEAIGAIEDFESALD